MIIDVSYHNGRIDWPKLKPHIEGTIIRCGYGNNIESQDDKQFIANVAECLLLHIPFGLYFYSYAKNDAELESELNHLERLVSPYLKDMTYPLFYDLEEPGTESFTHRAALRFIEWAKSKNIIHGLYASESWYESYLSDIDLSFTNLWIARWGSNQPRVYCNFWQYTNNGMIEGTKFDCTKVLFYQIKSSDNEIKVGSVVSVIPDSNEGGKLYVIDSNGQRNRIWHDKYNVLEIKNGRYLIGVKGEVFTALPASKLKMV